MLFATKCFLNVGIQSSTQTCSNTAINKMKVFYIYCTCKLSCYERTDRTTYLDRQRQTTFTNITYRYMHGSRPNNGDHADFGKQLQIAHEISMLYFSMHVFNVVSFNVYSHILTYATIHLTVIIAIAV